MNVVRGLIGVGLLAYLVSSQTVDLAALVGLVTAWELSAVALGLSTLIIILVSWRLSLLLATQGFDLPLAAAVRLSLIGAFFSAFLPGSSGGDVARMYFAARPHPGHGTEIVTVVAVDRTIGALSLLTLPWLVALGMVMSGVALPPVFVGMLWLAGFGVAVVLAVVLAGSHEPLRNGMLWLLDRIRLGEHCRRAFATIGAYQGAGRTIGFAFVLSLVIQALVVIMMLLLARATGASSPTWAMLLAVPFGMLANAVPVTPGGIGVGEAAFAALFAAAGATGGAEALLGWRVITTVIDLVGGVLFVLGRTRIRMGGRTEVTDASRSEEHA
jgi:uncharacterized membrane protein YbhN (UPF0104 family)